MSDQTQENKELVAVAHYTRLAASRIDGFYKENSAYNTSGIMKVQGLTTTLRHIAAAALECSQKADGQEAFGEAIHSQNATKMRNNLITAAVICDGLARPQQRYMEEKLAFDAANSPVARKDWKEDHTLHPEHFEEVAKGLLESLKVSGSALHAFYRKIERLPVAPRWDHYFTNPSAMTSTFLDSLSEVIKNNSNQENFPFAWIPTTHLTRVKGGHVPSAYSEIFTKASEAFDNAVGTFMAAQAEREAKNSGIGSK